MKLSKFIGIVVGLIIVMSIYLHSEQRDPVFVTLPAVFFTSIGAVVIGGWHHRRGRLK
jgi:hypothetical protein